ncbi:hypothetical protein [Tenacibaculum maritimum]|uniref:hypothetical protein n=3 Tax=Tenacibaculum maritimum TaxID=107401 RepID=UPI001E28261E|nr:hypothetical protein [Tenacibaculum maritimum]MCD9583352.1 hypothetical protein [Tenacibaculum maritimum]MCD9636845.1 hypothetical protein [Tenacibaculum maritimum]
MKTTSMLPKTNILFLLVLFGVLVSISATFLQLSFGFMSSPGEVAELTLSVQLIAGAIIFFKSLLSIFLGIWLYKKSSLIEENKYTWLFFGLFFGIFAVILFYLVLIFKKIESKKDLIKELIVTLPFNSFRRQAYCGLIRR